VTYEVSLEEFETLVARAIDHLPQEFADNIGNLEFSVEEHAAGTDYARTLTTPGATLLGVYRGVPLTRRGAGYNMALPDSIVIFRQPLQRIARDADDLYERVRRVVVHEVAHYFGISDERLREIDAY
jgi:predicted Zn-dependent protease with MMP-like domain